MKTLGPFLLASVALAITPGPGVLYIVARTLAQGRRAGFASVAGVALGNFGNASAVALGLSALFARWPPSFEAVRWAGAVYLLWLGLSVWRRPADAALATNTSSLRQAWLVALLNPKTALFFAAFLPPFLDPAGSAVAQSLTLGALFVAIAAMTDSLYVLVAGTVTPLLAGGGWHGGRFVVATVYVMLALLAVTY